MKRFILIGLLICSLSTLAFSGQVQRRHLALLSRLSAQPATGSFTLTIDKTNVDAELTNFVLWIELSSNCGQSSFNATSIFDDLGGNKLKIKFKRSGVEMYAEIEKWDESAKEALIHVNYTGIASSGVETLELSWDSSWADNTTYIGGLGSTPGRLVWNTDGTYISVLHMSQDPAGAPGSITNASATGVSTDAWGTMLTEDLISGQSGYALDFDGNDDYLNTSSSRIMSQLNFTIEVLLKTNSAISGDGGVYGEDNGIGDAIGVLNYIHSGTLFRFNLNHGHWHTVDTPAISANTWYYWVARLHSVNGMTSWLNDGAGAGTNVNTDPMTGTAGVRSVARYGSSVYFKGAVGEVRISTVARSDAWLKANYYNMFDNFLTIS